MPNRTLWRHTYPASTCPDAVRLLPTRATGRYRGSVACKKCRDWLEKSTNTGGAKQFTDADLSPTARACGVTVEQMQAVAPLVLVRGDMAVFPQHTGPALASAILGASGLSDYEFSHLSTGMPVYKPAPVG